MARQADPRETQVEIIVRRRSLVGEGAIWDAERQVLYWVDIIGHKLFVYDPATGENRALDTLQAVGTVVPRAAGGVVVALHNGFAGLDPDTGSMRPIADPERHLPANRFNDGKCDPAGRLWAGTMEFDGAPGRGALYCLEVDGTVTRKFGGVTISNGIVWSRDRRIMYYVDTGRNDVRAYDYDMDSGAIDNERVTVTNAGRGRFDGMTMDEEGMLWIAIFGGGAVRRYHPESGELLATVELPMSQITSCAFGGPDLSDLYVTSACLRLSPAEREAEPLAGSLVKVAPGVRGLPAIPYAG